jgi:hypothetical protein
MVRHLVLPVHIAKSASDFRIQAPMLVSVPLAIAEASATSNVPLNLRSPVTSLNQPDEPIVASGATLPV